MPQAIMTAPANGRDAYYREVTALRDRVAELEETIRQLSEKPEIIFPREWRLTPSESRLLAVLYGATTVLSKERILAAVYSAAAEEPEAKIVDVFVCKLRRKTGHLFEIETVWGQGYYLPPAEKKRVAAELDAMNGAPEIPPQARVAKWRTHARAGGRYALVTPEVVERRRQQGCDIRAARLALGLTQYAFSRLCGMAPSLISMVERSGTGCGDGRIAKMTQALETETARRLSTEKIETTPVVCD